MRAMREVSVVVAERGKAMNPHYESFAVIEQTREKLMDEIKFFRDQGWEPVGEPELIVTKDRHGANVRQWRQRMVREVSV